MYDRGNGRKRAVPIALYTERQVEATLLSAGISVEHDTMNDFICLCPFHGNTDSPAFSVSKTSGEYLCFNPACGEFGNLIDLVKRTMHKNDFEAARIINKAKTDTVESFEDQFMKIVTPEELPEFRQEVIDQMYKQFWEHAEAQDYMRKRGFLDDILHRYKVGYSQKKNLIAVPMYSEWGKPVGVIGRTIKDKRFVNSKKLPVRDTLWNIHRAKRYGDTVILCEASFDGMFIDQAGYPNVVACLGGNFNQAHATQIKKYFNKVILFVDWDNTDLHRYDKNGKMCVKCRKEGFSACRGHNPGRDLGNKAVELLRGKPVYWASYDHRVIYPHGAKDAGDLTAREIKKCIANSVSNLEYQGWGLYYQRDVV